MNKIYPNTEVEVVSTSTDGDFTHTIVYVVDVGSAVESWDVLSLMLINNYFFLCQQF